MHSLEYIIRLFCLLCWTNGAANNSVQAAYHPYYGTTTGSSSTSSSTKTRVKREHHVDYWDSDTLAYYLDADYPGYDLAIMFYASWDTHSHKLAPYWARIAEILKAGNPSSKLIMAFFDCEINVPHTTLCNALSVTAYPTIMFIGSGKFYDTDPITRLLLGGKDKSAGIMGHAPVPNTVKFQGNWQIYDSILDWIKTMQGLSRYHVWSQRLRNFFFRNFHNKKKKMDDALPIGIPEWSRTSSSAAQSSFTSGGGKNNASVAKVAMLEEELDLYRNITEEFEKTIKRTTTMMESLLLSGNNYTDMFAFLDDHNAFVDMANNEPMDDIYANCVLELSLDYCLRVTTEVGISLIDEFEMSSNEIAQDTPAFVEATRTRLAQQEPYCAILETCIQESMKDEACRPKECPFRNELACRYLTSCQQSSILLEYASALGLV